MPNETTFSSSYRNIIIGLLVLILVAAGAYYFIGAGSIAGGYSHQMVGGESIENWNFQGAFTGNSELEQKARDEITELESHIGNGPETDYSYYVSIANQYGRLGDGENEYEYLMKALAIDSETTGLAWHNLGSLLGRLGAKQTARDAYMRAVNAQALPQYITAYLEYLTQNFPQDAEAIENGFKDAQGVFGDAPALFEIRARWEEQVGKIDEAIATWEKVKELSPQAAVVIDAEIQRLKSL